MSEELTMDRRHRERRTTPPMAGCETICKPVDEKLDDIWSSVKAKPSFTLFYWALGGLAALIVILMGFIWSLKSDLGTSSTQIATLIGSVNVVSTQLSNANDNLKGFVSLIDRENARQDSRLEKIETKIELLHKPTGR